MLTAPQGHRKYNTPTNTPCAYADHVLPRVCHASMPGYYATCTPYRCSIPPAVSPYNIFPLLQGASLSPNFSCQYGAPRAERDAPPGCPSSPTKPGETKQQTTWFWDVPGIRRKLRLTTICSAAFQREVCNTVQFCIRHTSMHMHVPFGDTAAPQTRNGSDSISPLLTAP